jgi:uncharacterized protein YpmB
MKPLEKAPVSKHPAAKKASPWGVLISIVLILIIVIGSAYYAYKQRIEPVSQPVTSQPTQVK